VRSASSQCARGPGGTVDSLPCVSVRRSASRFASMVLCYVLWTVAPAMAGSVFLSGHDSDFHASYGGTNAIGAQHINQRAISFILDPAFNPYAASGIRMFLWVESNIPVPVGHIRGKAGIVASGYVEGVDFEHHDASTLDAELSLLGAKYAAIVVASDFGGTLTQAELDILNARSADIARFINAGGGLYALAESNSDLSAQLTPNGGHFGFLPFVVSEASVDQLETGFGMMPCGASLGLTDADVNGNFSHNYFVATSGLCPADTDAVGRTMSLVGRPTLCLETKAVSVPAASPWVDSEIFLQGGETVAIRAAGYWKPDPAKSGVGPMGRAEPCDPMSAGCPIHVNNGAVIARVAASGSPFFVGDDFRFVVNPTWTGNLQFQINDDNLEDNSGEMELTVDVLCPPTTASVNPAVGGAASALTATIHPNPFRFTTIIEAALPAKGRVMLDIYDVAGRRLRRMETTATAAGPLRILWDGKDQYGRMVPAGSYVSVVRAAEREVARKLIRVE
jgi:hypothetical protein